MTFLLDTNIISELRKQARADQGVRQWFATVDEQALFLSVLVLGEVRQGIEQKRKRDARTAAHLEAWLGTLETTFSDRLIPIDTRVADTWGRLNALRPLPVVDGLLAATALVHGLTLVTRNADDFAQVRVPLLNPFSQ